eukprot:6000625-Prymnesium_polylepis.1
MPLSPRQVPSSAPASHKKPAPNCPQYRSAKLPAPRRVPYTFKASVTHIKCASFTQEASALLPSGSQPNAAVAAPSAMHAESE